MVAPGQLRVVSPVAVDRVAELALIERAFEATLAGTPRAVVIGGEAGIGKSRLVVEALHRAEMHLRPETTVSVEANDPAEATLRREPRALRVLLGGCLALGADIPYLPFAEMLRRLARNLTPELQTAILGPAAAHLALLVPELAAQGGSAPSPSAGSATSGQAPTGGSLLAAEPMVGGEITPGVERLRLFESLLGVAERLAAERPVVAVVEDLQWADEPSLALLAYLQHGLRDGRLLLLLTVRPGEAAGPRLGFLADLERDARVDRIDLAGLSLADTALQLAGIHGERLERPAVERIHELSGGNPFYAEELFAAARDEPPDHPQGLDVAGLPPGLRDTLRARISRLPASAQGLMRVAAMTDRAVDARLLARLSAMSATSLEEGLRAAIDGHLLVRVGNGHAAAYRFRHELVRAFVASEVLPTESARLHAAFADALSSTPGPARSSAELAIHWEGAGDEAEALAAHVRAGMEADAAYAFEVAHHHFERALKLWDRVPDAAVRSELDRPRLAQRAADAAAMAGRLERAIELAQAFLAADDDEDDERQAELRAYVRSSLRWALWQAGRIAEATAEAERAAERHERDGLAHWQGNALAHLAGLRLLAGDVAASRRWATRALRVARAAGAREEEALALGILGWCQVHAGALDDGVERIRSVWREARDAVEPHVTGVSLAYAQLAGALELAGRLEEAVEVASDGADWVARHGLGRTFGRVLDALRARALYHLGRWEAAEAEVDRGLDLGRTGPGAMGLAVVQALLAAARGDAADVAAARSSAAEARSAALAGDSLGWLAAAEAEQALWGGDVAGALTALGARGGLRARSRWPSTRLPLIDASLPRRLALAARASADARDVTRGQPDLDPELLDEAVAGIRSELRRIGRRPALAAAWRAELACAAAEMERLARPRSAAEVASWRRAATVAASTARPYTEAYARWRLAEALLATRGERAGAAAEARSALELARRLGAAALAREVELLVRRARLLVDLPTGEAGAASAVAGSADDVVPFGLTEREVEVLGLVARGATNREIGERLFISPRTASVHVSNILGKMGVRGRVEAAALALRLGLADH